MNIKGLKHRAATEEDIAIICNFIKNPTELFYFFPKAEFPLTVSQLREAIAQRQDSTVFVINEVPVGFANIYRWEQGGCCSIGNVIISPEFRGQGVCRYLIATMCSIAREKYQASDISVSCFNQNTSGLLVYTALGFTPSAIEKRKDKSGNNVALIHLHLTV
ncbi:GNAT family N-acetyltransferase [Raoultella planticola]